MPKSKYEPIILESIDNGPVSIGTLKNKCGQGKKITNLRKALHRLLKKRIIEIKGYDNGCENFNYDCILIQKVDTNYDNPIFVKGLLDKPLEGGNYFELQKIFKNRIGRINQIYHEEIKKLKNIQGIMPLKEAIKLKYVKPERIHHREGKPNERKPVTLLDMLKRYPDAQIYFLKGRFYSKIALTSSSYKNSPFSNRLVFKQSETKLVDQSYINSYKNYLNHLPINKHGEQDLFNYFVIGALKDESEGKYNRLWELALDLTSLDLILFVEKLRVKQYINENYVNSFENTLDL